MKTGEVTSALHNLTVGEKVGVRAPMGCGFPVEAWKGKKEWEARKDIHAVITVDREFPGWEKRVGFVPAVLEEMAPKPANTIAITCGPPIMIKFVLQSLQKLQLEDEQIYTTLEKRVKCGIGICGRCNMGPKYVCVDGPVFSMAELREPPDELYPGRAGRVTPRSNREGSV